MGLSSAAARCGLYTASRTGFSSNRQLSVLPALNAYKPTLHVLFFCFVSHYNSAACNIQFIFQENLSWSAQLSKKESCEAGFSACGGSRKRHSTIPPQCDPRGAFLSYRNEVSYTIKRMCLGTFSRRGAVALATIYPCAECASSRSIFIVWKRSFLYDKKALCRECSQSTGPRIPILLASLTAAPARTYCRSLEWRFRNPRRSRR